MRGRGLEHGQGCSQAPFVSHPANPITSINNYQKYNINTRTGIGFHFFFFFILTSNKYPWPHVIAKRWWIWAPTFLWACAREEKNLLVSSKLIAALSLSPKASSSNNGVQTFQKPASESPMNLWSEVSTRCMFLYVFAAQLTSITWKFHF